MVFTWPYRVDEDRPSRDLRTVGPNLSWALMPGYDVPVPKAFGGGATGPHRVTIGFMDRDRVVMPLIVWAGRREAMDLARALGGE